MKMNVSSRPFTCFTVVLLNFSQLVVVQAQAQVPSSRLNTLSVVSQVQDAGVVKVLAVSRPDSVAYSQVEAQVQHTNTFNEPVTFTTAPQIDTPVYPEKYLLPELPLLEEPRVEPHSEVCQLLPAEAQLGHALETATDLATFLDQHPALSVIDSAGSIEMELPGSMLPISFNAPGVVAVHVVSPWNDGESGSGPRFLHKIEYCAGVVHEEFGSTVFFVSREPGSFLLILETGTGAFIPVYVTGGQLSAGSAASCSGAGGTHWLKSWGTPAARAGDALVIGFKKDSEVKQVKAIYPVGPTIRAMADVMKTHKGLSAFFFFREAASILGPTKLLGFAGGHGSPGKWDVGVDTIDADTPASVARMATELKAAVAAGKLNSMYLMGCCNGVAKAGAGSKSIVGAFSDNADLKDVEVRGAKGKVAYYSWAGGVSTYVGIFVPLTRANVTAATTDFVECKKNGAAC